MQAPEADLGGHPFTPTRPRTKESPRVNSLPIGSVVFSPQADSPTMNADVKKIIGSVLIVLIVIAAVSRIPMLSKIVTGR